MPKIIEIVTDDFRGSAISYIGPFAEVGEAVDYAQAIDDGEISWSIKDLYAPQEEFVDD